MRLWILLSLVWMASIAVWGYGKVSEIQTDRAHHMAVHRASFFDELSPAHRALLALDDRTERGSETFLLPHSDGTNWTQHLRAGASEAQRDEVWNAYIQISDRAYRAERTSATIKEAVVLAAWPCLLLGGLGWAVAWVVRGFRRK